MNYLSDVEDEWSRFLLTDMSEERLRRGRQRFPAPILYINGLIMTRFHTLLAPGLKNKQQKFSPSLFLSLPLTSLPSMHSA